MASQPTVNDDIASPDPTQSRTEDLRDDNTETTQGLSDPSATQGSTASRLTEGDADELPSRDGDDLTIFVGVGGQFTQVQPAERSALLEDPEDREDDNDDDSDEDRLTLENGGDGNLTDEENNTGP